MKQYIRPLMICAFCLAVCFGVFYGIKFFFFGSLVSTKNLTSKGEFAEAVTKEVVTTAEANNDVLTEVSDSVPDDSPVEIVDGNTSGNYVYSVAPTFEDDGSIIFDGKTLTELTNQLNKSLKNELTNTGYFYADYTRKTGLDPYLAVAITLEETGCSQSGGCSSWAVRNNNWGGMIGCSYSTLDEGLTAYLNLLYKNYYAKGLTTPESVANIYNPGNAYAYGQKIRAWMEKIKSM